MLNCDLQHCVRPGACLIRICSFLRSLIIALMDKTLNFGCVCRHYLQHASYLHTFNNIFTHIQRRIRSTQQVSNNFVINFNVADLKLVFAFSWVKLNLTEKLLNRASHNSKVVLASQHSMCLTSSCCSIRKNRSIIPAHNPINQEIGRFLKNVSLRGTFIKCNIECISLLFAPITNPECSFRLCIRFIFLYNDFLI
jgi:hypothetical protein